MKNELHTTNPAEEQIFTHTASLGGEVHMINKDNMQQVCDVLVKKYNGLPDIKPLTHKNIIRAPAPAATNALIMSGGINITGQVRATADEEAAIKSGFSPAAPLYTLGMAVNGTGVENAARSRLEHEAKPFVSDGCVDFIGQIKAEDRKDLFMARHDVQMNDDGQLIIGVDKYRMNEDAFLSLVNRLEIGGASYLAYQCWPELRAKNINEWAVRRGEEQELARVLFEREQSKTKRSSRGRKKEFNEHVLNFRTRKNINSSAREVFGVVTDSYTTFDVDRIAEALALAAPKDARGTVAYDGRKTRFEVMFHSDVAANEYVAGEIFKAGVIIKSADDGSGGLNVFATVWRNLCLNLIIIDENSIPTARIRHIGDLDKLIKKFREGFAEALKRIDHFRKAWSYAVSEDVCSLADQISDEDLVSMKIEDALPGIFNGLIERELVPVRGYSRKDAITTLTRSYFKDPVNDPSKITRSAIVNAITRFAHEEWQPDPWAEDTLQASAGALLFGKKGKEPEPLPYIAVGEEDEEGEE